MCKDQYQNQLHLTNKQVIPNEVTCNPTDDTARDDELSSSFASCRRTSNHDSNYFCNQDSNHQNGNAFPAGFAQHTTNRGNSSHQIQPRSNYCPMLPPLENKHNNFGSSELYASVDHYNHHAHPQSHFVNASKNYSFHHHAEQSLQKTSNTQPPKKMFIGRRTKPTQPVKAISRLFKDSIASTDTSGTFNVSTATREKTILQTQVRFKKNLFE